MPESHEKRITLIILCWLFGIFGAHRLYLGKYVTGALQALISLALLAVWCLLIYFDIFLPKPFGAMILFITPVWVLIDLIRIFMGRFTDKNGLRVVRWV